MGFYPTTLNQITKKGIYNNIFPENAYIEINSIRYPHVALEGKYNKNDYNKYYNTIVEFFNDYKGRDHIQYNLSKTQYKTLYQIIWFDLRYQQNYANVNGVQLNLRFKDDFDVNDNYYCVLLIETATHKTCSIQNKLIHSIN